MQKIQLFCYIRPDGGETVSTIKPDTEYTELSRLVADDGFILTDGKTFTYCTDTDNPSIWSEVVDTENQMTEPDDATEADYMNALRDMGVKA